MLQRRSDNPYDVIVVGARCAGSPLATLLARRGMRVCLIDRAGFPSDTPSTHGIQPPGVKILAELGVLDELLEVAPPIDEGLVALEEHRVEQRITAVLGAPMLNVRRVTLDAILLKAAAAAGAEVRTETAVTGLLKTEGRIVGVETSAGPLRASLVVGADGARSTVARLLGAREYHRHPGRRLFLWSYFEGVAEREGRLWIGSIGEDGFLASPTDAGLFLAACVVPDHRRQELRTERERAFEEGVQRWPELGEVLAGGRRVQPVRMMSRWNGFFRQSAGRGWVLVGDAGHFKDPTPGQGISDALRQVTALAPAIEGALGGGGDRPLREWWRWRDREAWQMYWFASEIGDSTRAPLVGEALASVLAADPKLVERFLRVLGRDLEPSKFLTPAATASVVREALRRNPGHRLRVARETGGLLATEMRRSALRASTLRRSRY